MRSFTSPSRRSLLIVGAALAAILLLLWLAPALFNAARLRDAAIAAGRAATGQEIVVHGATRLKLLPSPSLTLDDVDITPPADDAAAPRLHVASMRLGIPFTSLFASAPSVNSIVLSQPVLEVTHGTAWGSLSAFLARLHDGHPLSLQADNGQVIYRGALDDQQERVEGIGLRVTMRAGGAFDATGALTWRGHALELQANGGVPQAADAPMPFTFAVKANEKNMVSFSGQVSAHDMQVQGALKLALEQPSLLWGAPAAANPAGLYPVQLDSQLEYDGKTLRLMNANIATPDSAGKGEMALSSDGGHVQGSLALDFTRLKLDTAVLFPLLKTDTTSYLPAAAQLSVALSAENLFLGTAQFTNVTFKGGIADGQVQVQDLTAALAGNGGIVLSGAIQNTSKGPRFSGSTEIHGESLRDLLISLYPAAEQLSEKTFGAFYLHSNLFLSSEQLRISEADVRIANLQLAGGLVTYFEAQPRVEAEIALKNTNLDYFRDAWREERHADGTHAFILRVNSGVDFNWLKQLVPIVDLHVALDGFRFLDHDGQRATFGIFARRNELGIYNLNMLYPEGALTGKLKISVVQETPQLEVTLEMPVLDTAYFSEDGSSFGTPWVNPAEGPNRWSQQVFDFGWMIGVGGAINLTIGKLTHHGTDYQHFALTSLLKDEQLQVQKLAFERFGGKVEATGTLVGGKVPGISASFTLFNADLALLLAEFLQNDAVGGRVSVSGSLTTSGVSALSWVRAADAKLVLAGRGVRAQRFNLQGVVDAVNAARSVADVVANVSRALPSGSTDFSVDGNINLAQGILQTPGLALTSGRATGTLTGQVDLLPWTMALSVLFKFPMLKSDTIPVFTVTLEGAPDAYTQRVDTTALEAYVAKRIVGQ